jgi:LEA14-like dessication related protein
LAFGAYKGGLHARPLIENGGNMKIAKYVAISVVMSFVFCLGCDTLNALGVRKPTATLQGLKFQDISLESATLLFDVQVDNPYPAALPLLNMDYDLTSSNNPLVSGTADVQSMIPANGKKVVSLPAKINYLDLVKAFKDFRPGSAIPYKANLGLSVDTPALGKIRVPTSKEGQLSVPTIPNIEKIDWQKLFKK